MEAPSAYWDRAIILMDMNAFFASIEQLDDPNLRGKPVVVTNGSRGSCIITASYEARRDGIKTGMRLREATQRCPNLIRCSARPTRYSAISSTIMRALHDITPDVEVFSVDEAFLDVTHCQRLLGSPEKIARRVQACVWRAVNLPCSIGVSGDKTTAKYAAKLFKPNGLCVIPPWEAKARLANVPVTELCGIADGVARFLARYGVFVCGDMEKLPVSVLSQRFGNLGRRLWFMCQGCDPSPVRTNIASPKSMGHGKVMPPNTRDAKLINVYLQHMSERLAARLRRTGLYAQQFFIGLRVQAGFFIGDQYRLPTPTQSGRAIFQLSQVMMKHRWRGEGIKQVQITALDPSASYQMDLFETHEGLVDHKQFKLHQAMDDINDRYGEWAIMPANLLLRSETPNVIAPAPAIPGMEAVLSPRIFRNPGK